MPSNMYDFSRRAQVSEWMDDPCSYDEYRACVEDLEKVNLLLCGYKPTLRWISQYSSSHDSPLHLIDVGFGGGSMLRALEASAILKDRSSRLVGIDINPHAALAVKTASDAHSQISWITGNAFSYRPQDPVILITSSLFTHHLSEEEIVRFLKWMEDTAQGGWFINDLYRSAFSYHAFQALALVMRWRRFVRHDGPISIRRSFRLNDWHRMLHSAGIPAKSVTIQRTAFGRLCISRLK